MRIVQDFKTFALRGNVIDLAIAVVIGTAFGQITTSLVNDVIMPPIGLLAGEVDFSDLFINLGTGDYATLRHAQAAGAPTLNYGRFINTVVHFLLIAVILFLVVKKLNWMRGLGASPDPSDEMASDQTATTKTCPYCISTIPIAASRCPNCTSQLAGEGGDGGGACEVAH